MSDYDMNARELSWEDEIQNEESPFQLLPAGEYTFQVERFERARHSGSEKVPPCNKAVLTLAVKGPGGSGSVQASLFLYSRFEWKLCRFFTAIGQRRPGEAVRMNWQAVPGATGRCKLGVRRWTGSDGREHSGNEVVEFLPPEGEGFTEMPAGTPTPWDAGKF